MIRYLIKNNFKLMFRNTWSMVVMLTGPVLVIAVLSSAFSELMKSYEGVDEFTVGYRMLDTAVESDVKKNETIENEINENEINENKINENKTMGSNIIVESLKLAGEEAGIIFHEYPDGEVKEVMEKNELAGFVEFSKDSYIVYKSADYEVEGITLEYFMSKVMNESVNTSLHIKDYSDNNLQVENKNSNDIKLQIEGQDVIELPVTELDFMPAVNSKDYYGIVYIVYFCWCGMICATGVLSNEKKYGITRRFQVSNISEIKNYLGKYIPIVLTTSVGMLISTLCSILLFDINWGNSVLSAFIVFMMILAGSALGMMLYNISNSLVITIIMQFTIVWFLGYFGGSFETYMFSSVPDILKQLSPIYHGNRALVELSCMGKSDYVVSAVLYSLIITVICSLIAILAGKIRKRGKA